MQIRQHVGNGKPAVILHPSGTVVTFDELGPAPTTWRITSGPMAWSRVTSLPS